jgi:hypothetical protein
MTLAALTAAAGNSADIFTIKAALTSYPTGGSVAVTSQLAANYTTTTAATPIAVTGGTTPVISATASTSTVVGTLGAEVNTAWSLQSKSNIAGFKFTPTKAGIYVMTVWRDFDVDDVLDPTEIQQTVSITVGASVGYSAALSSVLSGTGDTAATTTTDALAITSNKATGAQAANIRVAIKNTSNGDFTGQTVTATIAGPGLLGVAQSNANATAADQTNGTLRATTDPGATSFVSIAVWPDGTAGVGTVTISVTDQTSGLTTVLGTESVTFYGSVSKLEATANYTILQAAGGVTGGSVAGSDATTYLSLANRVNSSDVPAAIIRATDSAGNSVSNLVIRGFSSNIAIVNSWTANAGDAVAGCMEDVLSAANVYSSGGAGYYNCALSTTSAATSGDTATLTFRILDPADPLGVAFLTAPVTVTVGGTVATETLSLDKTSYAPGEAMVITRTAKDKAGNPVADGTASPAISFNKAVGGTAVGAAWFTAGTVGSDDGLGRKTIFAPSVAGAFNASATSGTTALSFAATVAADTATSDIAQAAADAAAEATDAVAALSTQVAEQVNELKMQNDALRKQLVAITNLIIKIQKKVKA